MLAGKNRILGAPWEYDSEAVCVLHTLVFTLPIKKKRDGTPKIAPGSIVMTCFTSDFLLKDADEWRDDCSSPMYEQRRPFSVSSNGCLFYQRRQNVPYTSSFPDIASSQSGDRLQDCGWVSDGKQVSSGWIDHARQFAGKMNAKTVYLKCGLAGKVIDMAIAFAKDITEVVE